MINACACYETVAQLQLPGLFDQSLRHIPAKFIALSCVHGLRDAKPQGVQLPSQGHGLGPIDVWSWIAVNLAVAFAHGHVSRGQGDARRGSRALRVAECGQRIYGGRGRIGGIGVHRVLLRIG